MFGDENTFYDDRRGCDRCRGVIRLPNAFISQFNTPVQQLSGTRPEGGASSVAYLDGYYVFTNLPTRSDRVLHQRNPRPETMFDALWILPSLDAFPDNTLKVEALGADLWFAGTAGWEVWYDAGNARFPVQAAGPTASSSGVDRARMKSWVRAGHGEQTVLVVASTIAVYATVGYRGAADQHARHRAGYRRRLRGQHCSVVLLRPARAHLLPASTCPTRRWSTTP